MTGSFPTNKNTLYLLRLYSYNEIITVHGRPAICTLIGWYKSSRLFICSLLDSVVRNQYQSFTTLGQDPV